MTETSTIRQRMQSAWHAFKGDGPITASIELARLIYGGAWQSKAGVDVNYQTALESSTFLACTRVIADGLAQVPWRLYQDTGDSRRVASDHRLYRLLADRPNSWQTSFEFRETLAFHLVLTNNAYVFTNRVGVGRQIGALEPLVPGSVKPARKRDGSIEYVVAGPDGRSQTFGHDAIWHIRGPSWNSWVGLDAVRLVRNALGLAVSLEQGQAELQARGARSSGLYSIVDNVGPEKYAQLAAWLDQYETGGPRAGKPMVIDRGATYTPFTQSGRDQQMIESRKHQVEEICRMLRVMPLMVGHPADMAARAATESIFLHHVVHCLMPWYIRIEQSANAHLLSEADAAAGYYSKFVPNGLMRGSSKDRAEFYTKALGAGGTAAWMTQNEVRALEEMDRVDDPKADQLAQPVVNVTAKPSDGAGADKGTDDND